MRSWFTFKDLQNGFILPNPAFIESIAQLENDYGRSKMARYYNYKWSLIRKINNYTLLRMIQNDYHLKGFFKYFTSEKEKDEFNVITNDYLNTEGSTKEEILDSPLKKYSKLFLGPKDEKDLMKLHINVQRDLRHDEHRCHSTHVLSVFLLSLYLLETDIDVLTIARSAPHFTEKPKKKFYPDPTDRLKYPDGELFPENVQRQDKYYYLDPFLWLFLYHDWGYCIQLKKNIKSKPVQQKVSQSYDKRFNMHFYGHKKFRIDALKEIISFPFSNSTTINKAALIDLANLKFKQEHNHGVVSSLLLYHNFLDKLIDQPIQDEGFLGYKDEEKRESKRKYVLDILNAICLHDLDTRKISRIKAQDSIYYFLLKFTDCISDWSRWFQTKFSRVPAKLLDDILIGFKPVRLKNGNRGIKVNVVFDFSNISYLLTDEIAEEGYELEQFKKKREELECLDYTFTPENGDTYQWFFFELLLIDRHGERWLINNDNNKINFREIKSPLF